MDEILIEEKKYVSSKRAAKITGYAKDYIGQLCREGRVPARLVGRSWYVLESAIQDHRFGDQDHGGKESEAVVKSVFPNTWESPRYESSSIESIPPINKLRDGEPEEDDRTIQNEESKREEIESKEGDDMVTDDVRIHVHTVHEPLPEEFTKESPKEETETAPKERVLVQHPRHNHNRKVYAAIMMVGYLVAVVLIVISVIGTGYADAYLYKVNSLSGIGGISVYNK